MKSLPRAWWTAIALLGVFALSVLFDRYAMPFLSRDVDVWVIRGVDGPGCEGPTQTALFRFDRPVDSTAGAYKIPCDDFGFASETAALRCNCR